MRKLQKRTMTTTPSNRQSKRQKQSKSVTIAEIIKRKRMMATPMRKVKKSTQEEYKIVMTKRKICFFVFDKQEKRC